MYFLMLKKISWGKAGKIKGGGGVSHLSSFSAFQPVYASNRIRRHTKHVSEDILLVQQQEVS